MHFDQNTAFLACLWLLAFGLCVWELYKMFFGVASRGWKRITCKILKAYVDEHHDRETDDIRYSAHVLYAYSVQGRTYQSRRLTFRATRGLVQPNALGLLRGITQGRQVDAFYDPRHPSRAVLIRGISINNFVHLLLALAFLGFVTWKFVYH
jgi:Protein of unknown function (DUF3592)